MCFAAKEEYVCTYVCFERKDTGCICSVVIWCPLKSFKKCEYGPADVCASFQGRGLRKLLLEKEKKNNNNIFLNFYVTKIIADS